MNPDYWRGKVIVITGGSAGLGLAIAQAACARGAHVTICGRDSVQLRQAAESLRGTGPEVLAQEADVCREEQITALMADVLARHARIDCLVTAAGKSARGAIQETTAEDFQSLWDVNFLGTVRATRAALPPLLESRGHLVHIGSLAAKIASPFLGPYPVSKFAVAAYSAQLRLELFELGVHVMLVCPGPLRRADAGHRYDQQVAGLPAAAAQPGGGAGLTLIDPQTLAVKILSACQSRRAELIVPAKVRPLLALASLWPAGVDRILRRRVKKN